MDDSVDQGILSMNDAGESATKACPVCGETIKAVAIRCRFCNTDLEAFEVAREAEHERDLFVGRPAIIYTAGQIVVLVLTVGIAFFFYWLRTLSQRYHITTQRIRIERGFLSTVTDNVELFRIDHFDVHKPLGMRLLGQCSLHLRSSDTNYPELRVYGIPNLEALADQLRECSLRERARRHVTTFVEG
jgi:membrane protein YdbS with pleckstrin-like domain